MCPKIIVMVKRFLLLIKTNTWETSYQQILQTETLQIRCTRGVRLVFSVTRMRSSIPVLVWINLTLLLKKSCSVHMTVRNCCSSQCWQLDTIIDMMYVVNQSKQCAQIYLPKIASCLNLQQPIVIFFKSIT